MELQFQRLGWPSVQTLINKDWFNALQNCLAPQYLSDLFHEIVRGTSKRIKKL